MYIFVYTNIYTYVHLSMYYISQIISPWPNENKKLNIFLEFQIPLTDHK